ncbi:hypothetical protein IFM89_036557 [Coptis chinensis]|uniref:PPM-type phosphatase domain-containing protein n=1 Tax=Coptis chinensis TaxID=261450 RepID=A0A835LPW8_9MAGN|nr:hypothetical protein IFM89_036557 [Coptis chinensis]
MGGCCSKYVMFEGLKEVQEVEEYEEEEETCAGDWGARVRLKGSCNLASMFTQQGRKGCNQDAMTIWQSLPAVTEDFNGEPDMIFCGVFDGHGSSGHTVANHIREVLPSKLSLRMRSSEHGDHNTEGDHNIDKSTSKECNCDKVGIVHPPISSWAKSFVKAFEEIDKDLSVDPTIDAYCSGSTAVAILRQAEHLMIANLGDSRAILCTRNKKNKLVPVQLTVDLKPNLPCEAERIRSCNGRVFAMDDEPNVYRLWLPDEDSPGLAMARAFGDFCLKDFGLISTPKLCYRKISSMDEFVVLATDGVWDVLSNKAVVKIVASARKRSMAARLLVEHAVQAWKTKYPNCKNDDCAVVCLFLKCPSSIVNANSVLKDGSVHTDTGFDIINTAQETRATDDLKEEWSALGGVSRVNTVLNVPRFSNCDSRREKSEKKEENLVLNVQVGT